ncbi:hypothetical protein C7N43_15225 [Sphingobacteriales bacterium UPWRP_1]|nr:hypothetical protein BVG80_09075 [Sphingobacteriales bacterium TSM_CSM]PSJ76188.1 hypothetical protein C7N43_15225 [Sphingobacteriales bacterium UPWRP_1]
MKPIPFLVVLLLSMLLFLPFCKSPNQSSSAPAQKNRPSETGQVEIIVKLTQGANVDSLANAYSRYNVKPVQCLAPNHNMWLLTATVGNGYALVEILRKDKKIENAEINNAINPRQ